jgi:hypothetical protein
MFSTKAASKAAFVIDIILASYILALTQKYGKNTGFEGLLTALEQSVVLGRSKRRFF